MHRLWERHILDSLRCAAVVAEAGSALDLGSGGGLPGVPLAVACPDLEVVLVERRRGRAAFLELVVSEVGLPWRGPTALAGTEGRLTGPADLCTARAFSSPGYWRRPAVFFAMAADWSTSGARGSKG